MDGDPDRLRQVQANLLDNATKYSPPGAEICIQVAREAEDAVIRVSDCGEGLAPDTMAHIFEPFYQANPNKGNRLGGMGLGLSLVRLIVDQHGGSVEVRSDGARSSSVGSKPWWRSQYARVVPATPAPEIRIRFIVRQKGLLVSPHEANLRPNIV